jgi:hypothetical protein
MINIKLDGLDDFEKKLDHLASDKGLGEIFTNHICEKVPEARLEAHNFRYVKVGGKLELDAKSVSPELYSKIVKVLGQQ